MEYIATFFTHSGAIKFERFMKQKDILVILMPVPRKLSSSCGIAARIKYDGDIRNVIIEDIEKMYSNEGNESRVIYDSETDAYE